MFERTKKMLGIVENKAEPIPIYSVPDARMLESVNQEQVSRIYDQKPKRSASEERVVTRDYWEKIFLGLKDEMEITLDTFKKMRRDEPAIYQPFEFRRNSVLQRGGNFYYDADQENDSDIEMGKKMVEFLNYAFFTRLENGLIENIRQMLLADILGCTVAQKVLIYDDTVNKIVYDKWLWADPERITFFPDLHGNLKLVLQSGIGKQHARQVTSDLSGFIKIVPEQCIVYTVNKEFGNWYGMSRLRPAYKYWKLKDFLMSEWAIYMERQAMPFRHVIAKNASDMDKAEEVVASIHQGRSVVASTETVQIENKDTGSKASMFESGVKYCDQMMASSILLLSPEWTTGARAISPEVAVMHYLNTIEEDQKQINRIIDRCAVELIDLNFGKRKKYPHFKFDDPTPENIQNLAQGLTAFINAGVIAAEEEWIRKKCNFPRKPPGVEPTPKQPMKPTTAIGGNKTVPPSPVLAKQPEEMPEQKSAIRKVVYLVNRR